MIPSSDQDLSRRHFLRLSGVASLGFLGLHHFASAPVLAARPSDASGYGPLLPDPAGLLNLPKGFSYRIISQRGNRMSDGFFTPGRADGMATFAASKGRTILVRNHENSPGNLIDGPFGQKNELLGKLDRNKLYDYGRGEQPGLGGTTTLVYDPATRQVTDEYLSLAGTIRNCAGGATPWGSWISCEENTDVPNGTIEKEHGYNFEVPSVGKGVVDPTPLKAMGRFNHEAVCVDPRTGIVYQTEDRPDSLIYRYLPNQTSQLAKGGKLQALAVRGEQGFDTRNWESLGAPRLAERQPVDVVWLDLEGIDAPDDDLRLRGFARGAARFARGEGAWFGRNECYFACTSGGRIAKGQVFRYVPSPKEGQPGEKDAPGKLELFLEPNNTDLMKSCDNLTVAPWGDVVLCEDDPHPFLVGVTPKGELYKLGENAGPPSEFAGGVFSPSGDTFFVNLQDPGITLAITGPWRKG
ncbi:MAG: DUF839 domain-containing protein [Ferruginibacter sp.]|nr:DUF839 domain-containing protein [Cytophagales bacterium]